LVSNHDSIPQQRQQHISGQPKTITAAETNQAFAFLAASEE
jgi:hypothetical protein